MLTDGLSAPSDVRVLAEPRVLTPDGARASIRLGGDLSIPADPGGGATAQLEDFGIGIDIVPHILADGTVQLDISTAVDRQDMRAANPNLGTGAVLERHTRRVATWVDVPGGGTALLGGLFQEEDRESARRVPALSRVPTLGRLFREQSPDSDEPDLLLFVSPRMLSDTQR